VRAMKKALKVVGSIFGVVLLCVGAFALFVAFDWPVMKPVYAAELKVTSTPARVARGKQLVSIRCAGCHYDQKTDALTGVHMADAPKEFGSIYSHNITQHPTKGAGRYSDRELVYLLRTGIRRDGVFSGPFMQSPKLADEDMYSIIAFLRSDHPWVRPLDVDDRDWEPTFLAKVLMHVAFETVPMPKATVPVPDLADQVAYGRYVVDGMADCFACHSKDFKTMNVVEPEKSEGYLGGGNPTLDAEGKVVFSANLTMDAETGIGKWSEDDFVRTVRTGIRPDGRALRYPMFAYPELSEAEVKAAFAYLETVPTIRNQVDRNFPNVEAIAGSEGEKLYHKYACVSCHGESGQGICDLREASKLYETDEKLLAFLHDPSKFVPGTKMPTWSGIIAEREYAPLIAYVRDLEKKAKLGN
jgi:mono/diheme cytochrome c family protein